MKLTIHPVRTPRTRHGARRPAMPSVRAWIHAILARYVRLPVRAGGPERVLARPLSVVRERWLLASRTLLPQIHLAIQPVLRPRLWQTPTIVARTFAARGTGSDRIDRAPGLERPSAAKAPLTPVEPMVTQQLAPSVATPAPGLPPLQLVFQRLRVPARAIGTSADQVEGTVTDRTAVARRVTERSRRVERMDADAPPRVIAAGRANGVEDRATSRRGGPFDDTRHLPAEWGMEAGRRHGARARTPVAPQPAVNIAALADRVMEQIDDRLHAWRERTGF